MGLSHPPEFPSCRTSATTRRGDTAGEGCPCLHQPSLAWGSHPSEPFPQNGKAMAELRSSGEARRCAGPLGSLKVGNRGAPHPTTNGKSSPDWGAFGRRKTKLVFSPRQAGRRQIFLPERLRFKVKLGAVPARSCCLFLEGTCLALNRRLARAVKTAATHPRVRNAREKPNGGDPATLPSFTAYLLYGCYVVWGTYLHPSSCMMYGSELHSWHFKAALTLPS